jgi:beta-aspartyl-dipeptidase (metallo-type)
LVLVRNARIFAPEPRGIANLLLGGGRVLWIGDEVLDLPSTLGV